MPPPNLSSVFFSPSQSWQLHFSCCLWEHWGWGPEHSACVLRQVVASGWRLAQHAAGPCHSAGRPALQAEDVVVSGTQLTAHPALCLPLCAPQEIPRELTLDALLEMDEAKAKETLRRWGASTEECGRLQQALTCLRKVTGLGR